MAISVHTGYHAGRLLCRYADEFPDGKFQVFKALVASWAAGRFAWPTSGHAVAKPGFVEVPEKDIPKPATK